MREIKFRAFDSQRNEMVYALAYEEYAPVNDLLSGTENLMQYTGLKDKNGVKIYEGDIVIQYEMPDHPFDIKQEIFFSDGMFCVGKIGETETPLYLETNTQYRGRNVNLIEVIGNIYENPEFDKENK